ncbi:hypothetical protein BGX34_012155 [Mortierella sp. NVP85]|nr:hypothetical protein BGX34_012155 [Mortierella sp. NVP85]
MYIPVEEARIPVESVEGFNIGVRIVTERPRSDDWIRDIGVDQLPPRPDNQASVQWKKDTCTFQFERTALGIDATDNILEMDIPMVMNLDPKYLPAKVIGLAYKFLLISNVGVENLRLLSESDPYKPRR